MSEQSGWKWYTAGVVGLLVVSVILHLIQLLGTATLLLLLSVILALYFVGTLCGWRIAPIALVALIGGCTTYYATLLLAFLHFPGLDGIYLALILIPLMMPVGAAASGYLAFRLTKQRQGGGVLAVRKPGWH